MTTPCTHDCPTTSISFWLALALASTLIACNLSDRYNLPERHPDSGGFVPIEDANPSPDPSTDAGNTPDTSGPDIQPPTPDIDSGVAQDTGNGGGRPDPIPARPTLEDISRDVFAISCSPCHTDRVSGELSLRPGPDLHDRLLGPSFQAPGVARIEPGDPDLSYLWLKITNQHESVGGVGNAMPLTGGLTDLQYELIERWILTGAPE